MGIFPVLCLLIVELVNYINIITSTAYATTGGVIISQENGETSLRIVIYNVNFILSGIPRTERRLRISRNAAATFGQNLGLDRISARCT
jgi:hypothetical protein